MSSTEDRATEEPFVRSTVVTVGGSDGFSASAPIPLPRRARALSRRPSRLLPPASSRYPFSSDEASPGHWSDRVWIPAAVASLIVFGAIGFSMHTDWTAKRTMDREVAESAEMRTAALGVTSRPTISPPAYDRTPDTTAPEQSDITTRVTAKPSPSSNAHATTRGPVLVVAEPAPMPGPVTPVAVSPVVAAHVSAKPVESAGPPPNLEPSPPLVRQASMAPIAPPTGMDQPPPPLVASAAQPSETPLSVPRISPWTPYSSYDTSVMHARPPTPILPKTTTRPSVKASRTIARAPATTADDDPDAPPRTWHGQLHRELIRAAP